MENGDKYKLVETIEEFKELINIEFDDTHDEQIKSLGITDPIFHGLKIISKYTNECIQGADMDIIISMQINKLIKLKITVAEVKELNLCGWLVTPDFYLYHWI